MALADLSGVTDVITRLLELNLPRLGVDTDPMATERFEVIGAPPDFDTAPPIGQASVHLFHLMEDAHRRNDPPPFGKSGPVPVSYTPLSLTLQYVLTANLKAADGAQTPDVINAVRRRQKALGAMAKTIHDFPVVAEGTSVGGTDLFDPIAGLPSFSKKRPLELILKPTQMEESISFWSSEQQQIPPPSLFVEARVILLEPEEPPVAQSLVLSVGNFIVPSGPPQFSGSRSAIGFLAPNALLGPQPVSLTAVPARVALLQNDASASPSPPATPPSVGFDNNLLTLQGANFGVPARLLELRRGDDTFTLNLDNPVPSGVTSTANEWWQPTVGTDAVTVRISRILTQQDGTDVTLLPGLYTARLVVVGDGTGRPRNSNAVAFAITPQIADVVPTGDPVLPSTDKLGHEYAITLVGDYLNDAGLEVELSVGGDALDPADPAPTPAEEVLDKQFVVENNGSEFQVRFRTSEIVVDPEQPDAHRFQPIQLVINGATAPPAWAEVTL